MKIVVLANSFKEGGRCIAGIELNGEHHPIIENGRPKWIRPVLKTPHGELPSESTRLIELLDVIDFESAGEVPELHQSENVLLKEGSIKKTGVFPRSGLAELSEDVCGNLFGNRGRAVHQEKISCLNRSLVLVRPGRYAFHEKAPDQYVKLPQTRITFTCGGIEYDFPVTDPFFLFNYKLQRDLPSPGDSVFLTVSLGTNFQEWYYKLIAAVIY